MIKGTGVNEKIIRLCTWSGGQERSSSCLSRITLVLLSLLTVPFFMSQLMTVIAFHFRKLPETPLFFVVLDELFAYALARVVAKNKKTKESLPRESVNIPFLSFPAFLSH